MPVMLMSKSEKSWRKLVSCRGRPSGRSWVSLPSCRAHCTHACTRRRAHTGTCAVRGRSVWFWDTGVKCAIYRQQSWLVVVLSGHYFLVLALRCDWWVCGLSDIVSQVCGCPLSQFNSSQSPWQQRICTVAWWTPRWLLGPSVWSCRPWSACSGARSHVESMPVCFSQCQRGMALCGCRDSGERGERCSCPLGACGCTREDRFLNK